MNRCYSLLPLLAFLLFGAISATEKNAHEQDLMSRTNRPPGAESLGHSEVHSMQHTSTRGEQPQTRRVTDSHGAVVRGDTTRKELTIVFTGDEFADGGPVIRETLKKNQVKGSFFFTGKFYSNPSFRKLIRQLKKDGHYLGAHSDQHLLYCDWVKRDSLLVTESEFAEDLQKNYERMARFGIRKEQAPYFLPPYEWYNSQIAEWTNEQGLQLVNFTHGTRSTADYTYPQMGKSYRPSEEIYQSILDYEQKDPHGLNGFILLVHIGTDPRRTDKFYTRLDELIQDLKEKGYRFRGIDELLQ